MNKYTSHDRQISVVNFFSWDTSLDDKDRNGHLDREIPYYKALVRRDVRVCSLTWGTELDDEVARSKKIPSNTEFVPFHATFPRPGSKVLRLLLSPFILWPARHAIRKCDILRTEQMVGGWCAVLAKVVFRKPLVVRTGYEFHKFTIARGKSRLRRAFSYLISKATYSCADLILVTSVEDVEFVEQRFGIDRDRIRMVPNWTDVEKFAPSSRPRAKNEVLFVGRLDPQKNISMLIEALEETGWKITAIGDGPDKEAVQKMAGQKQVDADFLGNVPNNELVDHYRRCTVYALPSKFEGHPKTLLEAMACGCAVVGTDVDGVRSVITDGKDGILVNERSSSLRDGIAMLMEDAALRGRLGKAAAKKIRDELSLEKLLEKEVGYYRAMLNGGRSGA